MKRLFIVACIFTSLIVLACANNLAIAQSQTTVSSSPSPGFENQYIGWPLSIGGMIYDADRRPVSGAVVTLYLDGQMVNMSAAGAPWGNPGPNPTISMYYSPEYGTPEGYYSFFNLYPGIYEIVVEKGTHNTSATVDVNSSKASSHGMISFDVWLDDYHGPVWTQEQLSSPGAITGTIYDMNGTPVRFGLVTLMQNDQAMNIPHNPRYSYFNGTYVYRYILPGEYQVIVEKDGHKSIPVSVSMQNSTSYADITMYDYDQDQPSYFGPSSLTTTPGPSPTTATPIPTPSAGMPVVLISIALAMVFVLKFDNKD